MENKPYNKSCNRFIFSLFNRFIQLLGTKGSKREEESYNNFFNKISKGKFGCNFDDEYKLKNNNKKNHIIQGKHKDMFEEFVSLCGNFSPHICEYINCSDRYDCDGCYVSCKITKFISHIYTDFYKLNSKLSLSFETQHIFIFIILMRCIIDIDLLKWELISYLEFCTIFEYYLSKISLKYEKLIVLSYISNLLNSKISCEEYYYSSNNSRILVSDDYDVIGYISRYSQNFVDEIDDENINILMCINSNNILPSEMLMMIFDYIYILGLSKCVYENL